MPDPDGTTFAALLSYLDNEAASKEDDGELLLFADVSSLPQKPRTPEEEATFRLALRGMSLLYTSLFTAVVQVKLMPARPPSLDGCVIALQADAEAVRASAIVGSDGCESCEQMADGNVRISFATHAHAEAAVGSLGGALPYRIFAEWNCRPYD